MRKVSPDEWTGPWPPFTGAQITFVPKRPKPSKEELAKRRDRKMMEMSVLTILEKDPQLTALEYRGLTEEIDKLFDPLRAMN